MIPRGFIQDLLARVDIVDVIGRHVQLKKAGQNMLGLCPFHGEKTPSFTVSPAKQFYHCFGCGAHGNAIGFLMENRGFGYVEAVKDLAQLVGMTVPESERDPAADRSRGLTDLIQRAADFYYEQLKGSELAKDYLKGRGLTGVVGKQFSLGYSPDSWQGLRAAFDSYEDPRLVEAGLVIVGDEGKRYDRFRGRVMFPIRNRRGAVIGFGARSMDGSEPKYLNSPETPVFRKGSELYGLFEAQDAIRARRRVIVCEGYLDVIQLSQAGFGESVAALGTAITDAHVSTLLRLTDHVIFAFDGDAAGFKAARRALEATLPVITENKRASFVLLPDGEDPDSLVKTHGAAAFEQALSDAMPLSRWFVRALSHERDLSLAEDCAQINREAEPLLRSMTAGALRQQLARVLAEATKTPLPDIQSASGLKPWVRLPPNRDAGTRRPPAVDDLALRVLQALWAHPVLAREFNAQIATEFSAHGPDVERQIVEVWRAASGAAAMTPGTLLELLAESPFAAEYRTLSARDMQMQIELEAAREDLRGAFAKLNLRRLEAQRDALLAAYEQSPSPDALAAYRTAMQAAAAAKAQGAEPAAPA